MYNPSISKYPRVRQVLGIFLFNKPMKLSQVLSNKNQYSSAKYELIRSDGRLPDRTKPKTKADSKIHMSHIVDSSQYNLRHSHDHSEEMAFDYDRLKKEDPKLAVKYAGQTIAVMNPVYKKMNLKLEKAS